MKKIYLIFILGILLIGTTVAVGFSNIKDAVPKVAVINESKEFSGSLTYTMNETEYSCYLNEDIIDAGDIASCLGCKVNRSNGEIVCKQAITNIRDWNGNKLQEADEGDRKVYDFDKAKLEAELV